MSRKITVVGMVRGASFALGALVVRALLSTAGPAGYRWGIVVDVASFIVAAVLLSVGLRTRSANERAEAQTDPGLPTALSVRDWPFLGRIAMTMLFALAVVARDVVVRRRGG